MADNKQKWQDATRQILVALNLPAEYVALGLKLASDKPNGKGWIYCHSADVESDKSPSAGINVADGPYLGRYKDFRSGRTCTLFDFAASSGKFAGDWKQARNHYARVTGVKLPSGEEELVADRFDFFDLTPGVAMAYAAGKPGVTARAVLECGAKGVYWPKNVGTENVNCLLAFPMHGAALLDLEPTGWHCCAAKASSKIRKYQGQGNPDALLKTMTAGEYGLMNVDACNRIAEADVVWVVEGLTDMLAGQSVLGPWRDVDPDNRKHVVWSAGGCSYHPKAEWLSHFVGKDVRICFDVGDSQDEGQKGAAVWAGFMVPVAKRVVNVRLPLGASDQTSQKNDLRSWLNAGNTYDDLLDLSDTFEPIAAGDVTQTLSPNDAILANLGLVVIGEHEGTQKIEVFCTTTKKAGTIQDVDRLTVPKLIQLLGQQPVEQFVQDGKEQQAGKYTLASVKNAIADASSQKLFHAHERYGAGVWRAGEQVVIVKAREVGILNDDCSKIERSYVPFHAGCWLDITASAGDWLDLSELSRHLLLAADPAWCQGVVEELEVLLRKWFWRHKPAPKIVAGLVLASWVQSLWHWRPQVFLTGSSDTGKSFLLEDVLGNGIFGLMGLYVQKPTEAALRQNIKHHSKIPIIDEFEHDHHRQAIFKLYRTSSRGGEIIRGTADQKGASYRVKHLPWFAAVETGLRQQADVNRFIMLDLKEIPPELRGKISLPTLPKLRDLGLRLLAVALKNFNRASVLAEHLRGQQYEGVPGRQVECFGVPWGMQAAVWGLDEATAVGMLGKILKQWNFAASSSRDDVSVLREILTAEIQMENGKRSTVAAVLAEMATGDINDACKNTLERVGIKRLVKRKTGEHHDSGTRVLWFEPEMVRKNLLKGNSDYSGHSIGQYLERIPGAFQDRQRIGNHRFSGFAISEEAIDTLLGNDGDSEEEQGF